MNQFLVDQVCDHADWLFYIHHARMCYSDNIIEKYGLDDIIVATSKSLYKYSAELYLSYYLYLTVLEEL